MKVLVINPGVNRARRPLQRPGGPMSITEFLIEKGFPCEFIELCGIRVTKKLINRLSSSGPYDFLLLSIMGGEFVERTLNIAREWKSISPMTIIVAGGHFVTHHLSSRPHLWKKLPIDIFVMGSGEWIMPEILTKYPHPPVDPILIEGQTGNLDELPGPCKYLSPHDYISLFDGYLPGRRTFQMTTSKGCPYRCTFCHQNSPQKSKSFTSMSAERIIEECERLVREYQIRGFYFVDDLLSVDVGRLRRFCELKIKNLLLREIPFFGDFRTTDFSQKRVDLQLLAESGLRHVYVGFESGSDHIMERIGKDGSVDDHIYAIQLLKNHSIRITGSFVIGFPFETEYDLIKTRDFIISQKLDYSEIHFNGATWNNLDKEKTSDETLKELIHRSHWGKSPTRAPTYLNKLRRELLLLQNRPGFEIASILKMLIKGT